VARLPIRDDLQKMEGYHSAQVTVPVRLNTNESPYPPPVEFTTELGRRIADIAWNRYPDRTASALRAAIARSHKVGADQVFAGNGSNEILQTLLLAYAGAGRKVLTFEPTYQLHAHIARITGAEVVSAPRGADFRIDQSKLAEVFSTHSPDVTFVCSPNNPTGVVEDEKTVRAIIDSAPGLVIVDEAYAQFASWSAVDLVDESRALVVTRTYSKTWSMAAARLGYLVGPKWLVDEIDAVVLPYHLDAAKQIAGALALEFTNDMNSRVREIVASRDQIESAFSALPVDFWPSGANFILFRPRSMDGRKVWSDLVEKGVLIRDCSSWPGLTNCLRVTIGTPEENNLFLKSLAEVLSQ
jgi:histidinol-phosphate aminotransferase